MCPVLIRIGGFAIYWYGVMVAAAVFVCSLLFQRIAVRAGYSQKVLSELVFWLVVTGILGGRVLHILAHFSYYQRHVSEIVRIRNGGLSIQGAVLSSLAFLLIYLRLRSIEVLRTLDMIALCTPLGEAIGRIGCFLNGCCYGHVTAGRFGVRFPFLSEGVRVHPTQLYYSMASLATLGILYLVWRGRRMDGEVTGFYLVLFGLARYLIDPVRGDLVPNRLGLLTTQVMAIMTLLIAAVWFLTLYSRAGGRGARNPANPGTDSHPEAKNAAIT